VLRSYRTREPVKIVVSSKRDVPGSNATPQEDRTPRR